MKTIELFLLRFVCLNLIKNNVLISSTLFLDCNVKCKRSVEMNQALNVFSTFRLGPERRSQANDALAKLSLMNVIIGIV